MRFCILIVVLFLTGCSYFSPGSRVTIEAVNTVVDQLPKEYNYLVAKNGDTLEVLEWKLGEALDELSRIEAQNRRAEKAGEDIIRGLKEY